MPPPFVPRTRVAWWPSSTQGLGREGAVAEASTPFTHCIDLDLPRFPRDPLQDLLKDAAPHYRKAKKFYEGVAAELVQHSHTLDIFACSLDQVRQAATTVGMQREGSYPGSRGGGEGHDWCGCTVQTRPCTNKGAEMRFGRAAAARVVQEGGKGAAPSQARG